ncbi:hypothetical protein PQ455_05590 [Sphingomonas naphthae]|uniref:UrcA family protein n=1 Tax=Sphingomonas naphthae TaxID=1813468 RepID=A0ABY7TN87_9SPHN|nr:hypothetical protein [Sphingomonas naphthae]WCT74701.1 hypothetical protein PQ455_05590 [Sphingomonas naphthae]
MIRFALAAGLALSLAAPAAAQNLHETHEEVRMPAGKTVKLYRPIARAEACGVSFHHRPAGKLPTIAADTKDSCATEYALNEKKGEARR